MYIGLDNAAPGGIEIRVGSSAYIDFTTTSTDFKGRNIYNHNANSFVWQVGGTTKVAMKLLSTGLSVHGTVTSSDKRLKFNKKPLTNALDVINKLEPVEYDQTYDRVDQLS